MKLISSEAYVQSRRLFLHEEITFKNVEKEKVSSELRKIITDLRTVINLIDWTQLLINLCKVTSKRAEKLNKYKVIRFLN